MNKIAIFLPLFSFLNKIPIFLSKISIFHFNLEFWTKFRFLSKILIFYLDFDFWTKFQFFIKISIFQQDFCFWTKLRFFIKNFDFYQDFDYRKKFRFLSKITIFHLNFEQNSDFYQKKNSILHQDFFAKISIWFTKILFSFKDSEMFSKRSNFTKFDLLLKFPISFCYFTKTSFLCVFFFVNLRKQFWRHFLERRDFCNFFL